MEPTEKINKLNALLDTFLTMDDLAKLAAIVNRHFMLNRTGMLQTAVTSSWNEPGWTKFPDGHIEHASDRTRTQVERFIQLMDYHSHDAGHDGMLAKGVAETLRNLLSRINSDYMLPKYGHWSYTCEELPPDDTWVTVVTASKIQDDSGLTPSTEYEMMHHSGYWWTRKAVENDDCWWDGQGVHEYNIIKWKPIAP